MGEFSSKKINEIHAIYQSIYSCNNVELDEQQSDVSKQWERGARLFGRATDKYVANPVSSAIRSATDYVGQAGSGIVKAATGGSVDLEKIGRNAERVLSGGGKPQSKPPVAKQSSPPQTPEPTQSQDLGKRLGQWLVPSPEKSADPEVRSGRRTPSGIPIEKPSVAEPRSTIKRDPKGAVIVNHFESDSDSLVTEAPAQVAPITGVQGKAWYQKSKSGTYVPITDPSLAKQASERWKSERAKPKPEPKLSSLNAQGKIYTGPKYGYQSWQTATAKRLLPSELLGSEPPSKSRQTLRRTEAPASQPPAAKPPAARAKPPAARIQPSATRPQVSQTGDRTKDLTTWALANKGMIDKVGTKSQREILKAAQSGGSIPMPAPRPLITKEEKMESFDIILEYLISQGHVETLDEALYVMMEMDAETIGTIVEAAADQSDKQIEKGVKTTYKAGNVLDNQHQGRSRGLSRLPAGERAAKTKRMRERLNARRADLFGERRNREDAAREEMKKKYGL